MTGTIRHRKRRVSYRRRSFRAVISSDPVIWAVLGLMVGCAVVLAWAVWEVL